MSNHNVPRSGIGLMVITSLFVVQIRWLPYLAYELRDTKNYRRWGKVQDEYTILIYIYIYDLSEKRGICH